MCGRRCRRQRDRHDYLRAQTIGERQRTASLALLRRYERLALNLSHELPNGSAMRGTAPRLYVDSLNTMIDHQTSRLSALNNRVPDTVFVLEPAGAAVAIAMLTAHLSLPARGRSAIALAAGLLALLLLVTFDLDRPLGA